MIQKNVIKKDRKKVTTSQLKKSYDQDQKVTKKSDFRPCPSLGKSARWKSCQISKIHSVQKSFKKVSGKWSKKVIKKVDHISHKFYIN